MNKHKVAFAGFRHAHIFDLYQRALDHPAIEVVATCEENFESSLMPAKGLNPDFTSFQTLLAEVDCDIVALGDTYGRRGAQAIGALESGRHVIADKPLCTSLDDLGLIERLANERSLSVGLMLDLRDQGNWMALRDVILSGRIGEVQTVSFSGQHPLMWGRRPSWYFEPGMHGGTLNDIAIHAVDFIPWVTGHSIADILLARTWNAKAADAPHFADCAQMALRLSNGAGVLGDVSYLAPDGCGFGLPNYWRVTVHGTRGFAETSYNSKGVTVADDSCAVPEILPAASSRPGGYLEDFLAEIAGSPRADGLTKFNCLASSRLALQLELKAASKT